MSISFYSSPWITPQFGAAKPKAAKKPSAKKPATKAETKPAVQATPQPVQAAPAAKAVEAKLVLPEKVARMLLASAELRTVAYRQKIQKVLDEAKAYLTEYAQKNDPTKSAICFDIDDTILDGSAFDLIKLADPGRFKYNKDYQLSSSAAVIPETKAFFDWCREKGFNIYFICARKEYLGDATVANLSKVGITPDQYVKIFLQSNDAKYNPMDPAGQKQKYKRDCENEIEAGGHKIAAVIGDQNSDVTDCKGKGFKLPNNMYGDSIDTSGQ